MAGRATLSMYDFAAVTRHTDAYWASIAAKLRARGVAAPECLTRGTDDWAVWRDPDMMFSQTCGFPYVSKLQGIVGLIGTPDYGVIDGKPGWYNSVVICRADDPRPDLAAFAGAQFAYNDLASQSGVMAIMYLLHKTCGDGMHFGQVAASGGHALSAQMVAQGHADIAAIDCVTWANILRDQPGIRLRVLAQTDPTPGLPYITSLSNDAGLMADAVEAAIADMSDDTKGALMIRGFWRSTPADYEIVRARALAATPVIQAHFDGHCPLVG